MIKELLDFLFERACQLSARINAPVVCYINFDTLNVCVTDDSYITKKQTEAEGYSYLFTVFDDELIHINEEYSIERK